jgi:hypothetical protein
MSLKLTNTVVVRVDLSDGICGRSTEEKAGGRNIYRKKTQ